MSVSYSETAYAKVNLALHVRAKLPDDYHQIDTIFAFLDKGDSITVEENENIELTVTGPFADGLEGDQNLAMKAGHLLAEQCGVIQGAAISLEKNLPVASGIGGGSADAAATMRLLNRFWKLGLEEKALAELSRPLGADVPACIYSRTCRAVGIGQDIEPLESKELQKLTALLINPLQPISTAQVFANWNKSDSGALIDGDVMEMAIGGRNDLESAAINIVPAIKKILNFLHKTGPILARMSGSGATCFGLYQSEQQARDARDVLSKAMPNLWMMIGQLR